MIIGLRVAAALTVVDKPNKSAGSDQVSVAVPRETDAIRNPTTAPGSAYGVTRTVLGVPKPESALFAVPGKDVIGVTLKHLTTPLSRPLTVYELIAVPVFATKNVKLAQF